MKASVIVAAAIVLSAATAHAAPPSDISDLVGARAAGAESEMQARGYEDVGGNNTWWNAASGSCAKVHVSNGRYSRIDKLKPSQCGQHGKPSAPSAASVPGEAPQAAVKACMRSADQFQNAKAGTSVASGAQRAGPNWVLTMATGTYTSKCTVTGSGKIVSMDPI